jgi:hypothetical protein
MRSYILLLLILFSYHNLYSQVNSKVNETLFFNINLGTEFKKNNSDSLTMGIINLTPLGRLSAGMILRKKLFCSMAATFNQVDIRIKNDRMIYKKFGAAINLGLKTGTTKFRIQNQIGIQTNDYSVVNLKKDNINLIDSFQYNGNYFNSKDDFYIVYGFELYSRENKNINYMGGISTGYAISKATLLTKSYKERISFQLYFGLSYSI